MTKDDRHDFGLISKDEKVAARCEMICKEFDYSFKRWASLEDFVEGETEHRLVLADSESEDKNAIVEFAQVVRQVNPNAFFICSVSSLVKPEAAAFAKKSGTDLILLKDEALNSAKLEFICTQTIRSRFLPIKVSDLAPDVPVTFDVFHLIPERKKFLNLAFSGDLISAAKIAKAAKIGEMYVRRTDAELFSRYVKETTDMSAEGLAKRCRSQFLALCSGYTKLVFLLSDRGEHASFKEGEALLANCRKLAGELLSTLGATQDAFGVVNNSAIGDFGSVERSPAIASYAGVFSLSIGLEKVDDIMLAALIADIALLTVTPEIARKIRLNRLDSLTADERAVYERHPKQSLELALSRKLSLEEKLRSIIVSTHERADGTGFPNKLPLDKLKDEPQIIQFSRELDKRTLLTLGKARLSPRQALRELLDEEMKNANRFSPALLRRISTAHESL